LSSTDSACASTFLNRLGQRIHDEQTQQNKMLPRKTLQSANCQSDSRFLPMCRTEPARKSKWQTHLDRPRSTRESWTLPIQCNRLFYNALRRPLDQNQTKAQSLLTTWKESRHVPQVRCCALSALPAIPSKSSSNGFHKKSK